MFTYRVIFRSILAPAILPDDLLQPFANAWLGAASLRITRGLYHESQNHS